AGAGLTAHHLVEALAIAQHFIDSLYDGDQLVDGQGRCPGEPGTPPPPRGAALAPPPHGAGIRPAAARCRHRLRRLDAHAGPAPLAPLPRRPTRRHPPTIHPRPLTTRTSTMRNPFESREIWFLTGSQGLYGPETLDQVAEQSRSIASTLDAGSDIPVKI